MDVTVQTLIQNLSNNEADLTQANYFYTEVLGDLSQYPILTRVSRVTSGTGNNAGQLALPSSANELHSVHYTDTFAPHAGQYMQLGELSIKETSWLFPQLYGPAGRPTNFIRDITNQRQLFLIPPTPTSSSNDGALIYSESRNTLPQWLQLPVALLILAKEYRRESDHMNTDVADACEMFGMYLINIVISK